MTTRLSVLVNDETGAALTQISADHDVSVGEVVRRATGLYAFVKAEQRAGRRLIWPHTGEPVEVQ